MPDGAPPDLDRLRREQAEQRLADRMQRDAAPWAWSRRQAALDKLVAPEKVSIPAGIERRAARQCACCGRLVRPDPERGSYRRHAASHSVSCSVECDRRLDAYRKAELQERRRHARGD
ncbi:hypothetical protein [uncultured Albimonas sp.]|uniref:hypothetical protein n=1 Tax=uncultured Albimonas sp. TaxID=1331701 RepID=UPI0030EE1DFF